MKQIKVLLKKHSGRGPSGQVNVRHQGGRAKRFLRKIDFKRNKRDMWATVLGIEYDPNRNSFIALLIYEDGERRYILAPEGLKAEDKVIAGDMAPITPGNSLAVSKIPAGTEIHNIEIFPGKGGQMVRSAGMAATIQSKEEEFILIKLPSGEVRRFAAGAYATIGKVGRAEYRTINLGKAGRKRNLGIRPRVRGVAMHPGAHPHGGGEGRSGVGLKYPKTKYGRPAVGNTRKKNKYSSRLIVSPRKPGPHH